MNDESRLGPYYEDTKNYQQRDDAEETEKVEREKDEPGGTEGSADSEADPPPTGGG